MLGNDSQMLRFHRRPGADHGPVEGGNGRHLP